jgi:hypothetical protein
VCGEEIEIKIEGISRGLYRANNTADESCATLLLRPFVTLDDGQADRRDEREKETEKRENSDMSGIESTIH